ncbi:MAG: DUF3341 domain-containing protein [Terriglobales bacterium]
MRPPLYGIVAEFETPSELLTATRRAYLEGYRKMDAYTPFPIPDLAEALGFHENWVPLLCLIGGILGGSVAFLLQYWINVIAFPVNVGGRPLFSWPSFIPVTFEMTVLFAGFGAFFGMWALNGLPMPFHPVFNVERFAFATRDRFFLCIESSDPRFDPQTTRAFLESLNPHFVQEVPNT